MAVGTAFYNRVGQVIEDAGLSKLAAHSATSLNAALCGITSHWSTTRILFTRNGHHSHLYGDQAILLADLRKKH